jgi:hypothetical protein
MPELGRPRFQKSPAHHSITARPPQSTTSAQDLLSFKCGLFVCDWFSGYSAGSWDCSVKYPYQGGGHNCTWFLNVVKLCSVLEEYKTTGDLRVTGTGTVTEFRALCLDSYTSLKHTAPSVSLHTFSTSSILLLNRYEFPWFSITCHVSPKTTPCSAVLDCLCLCVGVCVCVCVCVKAHFSSDRIGMECMCCFDSVTCWCITCRCADGWRGGVMLDVSVLRCWRVVSCWRVDMMMFWGLTYQKKTPVALPRKKHDYR